MTYNHICQNNKLLYEALERLTAQIIEQTEAEDFEAVKSLKTNRNAVKGLIDKNLDDLERLWKREAHGYATQTFKPNGKELMIIKAYKENPQSISQLAFDLSLRFDTVNRVITNYLTKKYTEVSK